MKTFLKQYGILILIIILGAVLRLYNLSSDPAGFFTDEASVGYNAYSIAHFGKDEYGISHPFFFKAFGEYKNPIEIYSTAPFVGLFGLNEFTTRLPSAIYGTLGIIAIYLLTLELFANVKKKQFLALATALLLTISPWDIQFSRVSLEGLMAYVFFTLLGTYFFLRKKRGRYSLFISAFLFLLAFYSYFPARIFIPLYVVFLLLYDWNFFWQNKKKFLYTIIIFFIGGLPMLFAFIGQTGLARFEEVSIFAQPPQDESIPQHIALNYYTNLSPDFLFFKGDIGMPGEFITRHSVKGMGELYFWQLPFIFLSFIFLIVKKQWRVLCLLLAWIVLYPTGSMLTTDESVQATRAIIGVVPWQILTASGLFYSLVFIKQRILLYAFIFCFSLIFLLSFIFYTKQYFIMYPTYSADYWGWQYGYRPAMLLFSSEQQKYDDLFITHRFNYGEELLKFYQVSISCPNCQVMHNPIQIDTTRKQVFALRQDDIDQAKQLYPSLKFVLQKTILQPNGEPALFVGIFKPK